MAVFVKSEYIVTTFMNAFLSLHATHISLIARQSRFCGAASRPPQPSDDVTTSSPPGNTLPRKWKANQLLETKTLGAFLSRGCSNEGAWMVWERGILSGIQCPTYHGAANAEASVLSLYVVSSTKLNFRLSKSLWIHLHITAMTE